MTGVLRRFLVYKGEIIVGTGWLILYAHVTEYTQPTLIDNTGEHPLPEGWYTLVPVDDDKDKLVIAPRRIQ